MDCKTFLNNIIKKLNNLKNSDVQAMIAVLTEIVYQLNQKSNNKSKCVVCEDTTNDFCLCIKEPLEGYMNIVTTQDKVKNIYEFTQKLSHEIYKVFLLIDRDANNTHHPKNSLIHILANLNSQAQKIICKLTDSSEKKQKFSYFIIPGTVANAYTDDISLQDADKSKVSVMYIPEDLLSNYQPNKTLLHSIITHEISHQVGSQMRFRKERVRYLINCFLSYLLFTAFPVNKKSTKLYTKLIEQLCKDMAEVVLKQYYEYFPQKPNEYLLNMQKFLKETQILLSLITHDEDLSKGFICPTQNAWDQTFKKITSIDKKYCIRFATKYCHVPLSRSEDVDETCIGQLLFQHFQQFCRNIKITNEKQLADYVSFCGIIMNSFSESYADLRMIELMNIQSYQKYQKIYQYKKENQENSDYETLLRDNAAKIHFEKKPKTNLKHEIRMGYVCDSVQKYLTQYLVQCKNPKQLSSN